MSLQNGLVLTFYPNGQVKRQTLMADGKPTGTCKLFGPDGSLLQQETHRQGVVEQSNFYRDGKLKQLLRIRNDQKLQHCQLQYRADYDERGLRVFELIGGAG